MIEACEQSNRAKRSNRWLALFIVLTMFSFCVTFTAIPYSTSSLSRATMNHEMSIASEANRIALVKPVFSATAYSAAFYEFYSRYNNVPPGECVTTDLNLLNRTIVDKWAYSGQLGEWFTSNTARSLNLVFNETVTLISEIQVDEGSLFRDGVRVYDVLILGFTEYVTMREYLCYKRFVESGGTLIVMDACTFLAEVTYSNGYLSLTKGHGWEFNGTHAWKSVYHRWPEENLNWVGSNFWKYWYGRHYNAFQVNTTNVVSNYIRAAFSDNISTSYRGHEENLLQNFTETDVIGYWNFVNASERPSYPVAAYVHRYGRGMVIHSGIMASDAILNDDFLSMFLAVCIRFGLTRTVLQWKYPEPLLPSDDSIQSSVTIHEGNGGLASGPLFGLAYCDVNFTSTRGVLRHYYRFNLNSVTGIMTEQADVAHPAQNSVVLHGWNVSGTCWRLNINTFLFANGDYRLTINATWKGDRISLLENDSVTAVDFTIQNSWWISIFPWAAPMGAALSAGVIIFAYVRFDAAKSRTSLVSG